jgi:hypothetical protein
VSSRYENGWPVVRSAVIKAWRAPWPDQAATSLVFILINQMSDLNGQVMATELYDAIERRVLASYQLTKEGKEYLRNCELKPTLQEKETICASKTGI